jgi:hypothetical protein
LATGKQPRDMHSIQSVSYPPIERLDVGSRSAGQGV